jgi:hypothetical protein
MNNHNTKRITKALILRAVASSSAIETGTPTQIIEKKLKSKKSKFHHLTLAN